MAESQENQDFLTGRNIERFSRLLEVENDPVNRSMLKRLLREERARRDSGRPENDSYLRGPDIL